MYLARQIKPGLPVIYLTGAADTLALREQRDPIIMKPYSCATLLKIVSSATGSQGEQR